jgi:peptide/nickel transport system permease protein
MEASASTSPAARISARGWPAARIGARLSAARTPRQILSVVLLGALPVALISTLIIFLLTYLSKDNPAAQALGQTATPAAIARLNHLWGLDRSFPAQYFSWLGHALSGDLGRSWFTQMPVASSIWQRLPVDLSIAGIALFLAVLIGFPAGIISAVREGGITDRAVTLISSLAITIPVFWVGIMLVVVFSVRLRWLPATGYVAPGAGIGEWLSHTILPGFALSLLVAGTIARQLRTSVVAALQENYVVGARVRGLSQRRILLVHVLRNAAAPTVAAIGLEVPQLLGGAVITETVFALPGIGQYALEGAQNHDVPVIQGVLIVMVGLVLISNLGVDLLLGWMRPATRRSS